MYDNIGISLEISIYRIKDNFLKNIEEFIPPLNRTPEEKVRTISLMSQVLGALEQFFASVLYSNGTQCPFVLKILNKNITEMPIKDFK